MPIHRHASELLKALTRTPPDQPGEMAKLIVGALSDAVAEERDACAVIAGATAQRIKKRRTINPVTLALEIANDIRARK